MKQFIYLLSLGIFLFGGCNDSEDKQEEQKAPEIISSVPENDATGVKAGETNIKLLFNQEITISSSGNITLNGTMVDQLSASVNALTVTTSLQKGTSYELIVPAGKIQSKTGTGTKQPLTLSFSTEEAIPSVVSSEPGNGDYSVEEGEQPIEIVFDREIKRNVDISILLNELPVEKEEINQNRLLLTVQLERNKEYVLKMPVGAIESTEGIKNTEEILIQFRTRGESFFTGTLVTPDPSKEVINVFKFLSENYGNRILSGTMANVNWNTNEAQWVYQHTGKWPAMNTFDFLHFIFSPSDWINYEDTKVAEDWWNENGLVGAMWHWNVLANNGVDYTCTPGTKPEETSFDAGKIFEPESEEYIRMIRDMDKIAGYLGALRDKNIPVIWRPLHEAAGNSEIDWGGGNYGTAWFWWGMKGPEACKEIWRVMFDRFVHVHGLNNLIWVWTTENNDPNWYPGDEYVDIIGRDIYNKNTPGGVKAEMDKMTNRYGNKMATLSECGGVANISEQWSAGANWSWFTVWYDYARTLNPGSAEFNKTNHEHASAEWWKDAMNQRYVITRDKMPSLK